MGERKETQRERKRERERERNEYLNGIAFLVHIFAQHRDKRQFAFREIPSLVRNSRAILIRTHILHTSILDLPAGNLAQQHKHVTQHSRDVTVPELIKLGAKRRQTCGRGKMVTVVI